MKEEIDRFLGSIVEELLDFDGSEYGLYMIKFLCVRVILEIDKPLSRCLRVDDLRDGMESAMLVKYEWIPEFCFRCEFLGLMSKDCPNKMKDLELAREKEFIFGFWMRATALSRRKGNVGRHRILLLHMLLKNHRVGLHRLTQHNESASVERYRFLSKWYRNNRRSLSNDILSKNKELKFVSSEIMHGSWKYIKVVEDQLNALLSRDEVYWKQRARIDWLREGDRNTRFFNLKASERKTCNRIHGLFDTDGQWQIDPRKLTEVVVRYFSNLFCSNQMSDQLMDEVLDQVQPLIHDGNPIVTPHLLFSASSLQKTPPATMSKEVSVAHAFIPDRLIIDNAIIGFECLHVIRNRKQGSFALKLDMSKPYDQVEWPFLARLMQKLGFSEQWIVKIMNCASTSIVLCNSLSGFRCKQPGPNISHLFFMDDNLLFSEASENECRTILQLLDDYSDAYGQVINFDKLAMCFSKNISWEEGERLASVVGVKHVKCHERQGLSWVRGIIERGSLWRIGRGDSVKHMDHWIPKPITFKVISRISLDANVKVDCLKMPSGNCNLSLLKENFIDTDVDAILSTPSSSSITEDSLLRYFEKNGLYSVRSGYRVGRMLATNSGSSSLDNSGSWWKALWILKLSSKIKLFIWKVSHHWLPTMAYLARPGVPTDGIYPRCFRYEESMVYALWGCRALAMINTDATVCRGEHLIGQGVIIRDRCGKVIAATAQKMDAMFSPTMAEAMALKNGIQLELEEGCVPFLIETDSLQVVSLGAPTAADVGPIIEEVSGILRSFPSCTIGHVSRKNNEAAHRLAQKGLYLTLDCRWLNVCPLCMERIVLSEASA
ncbi:hypothetical protein Ddye_006314 [Dipteronia dyeriana]|uniref:RNase H type-1 domain-containing protein n=1 Tax=Dipteronia dyeriana TaxID=168575 RepID=A0AAD9XIC2_9ROSI|nr:hypothetical protein Ddye_006314 [Dipteronia dyeriana]